MIKSIAKVFRLRHVGKGRFIAVHIRPYPDACLDLWRSSLANFDYVAASKACQNPNLVHIVVNQTLDAIKRYNVSSNVFVMCHPAVRNLILELYGAAGMKPFFFNEDILGPIFGFSGPALLGMVEQEICNQADVFIGTGASTMTGIVYEERSTSNPPKLATENFLGDH
ncbi:hypothetical protein PLESTM_001294200 [Pleodorina starrii]|nr:hypothetical protein PLESTM_001294200 [Pleodorina starrii]